MKRQRPLNTDGSEAEALAKNVFGQESALVERYRPDVRMGSEAAKSHAVRWPCRRIPDDGLPAVPGAAAIAVAIVVFGIRHMVPGLALAATAACVALPNADMLTATNSRILGHKQHAISYWADYEINRYVQLYCTSDPSRRVACHHLHHSSLLLELPQLVLWGDQDPRIIIEATNEG
jgi:hypothetical protein